MRLDVLLTAIGEARSRTHAANLIKQGKVFVKGAAVYKPALDVLNAEDISVSHEDDFASLGGIKLKTALDKFDIDVSGAVAIDIGASNGGFTDVLLTRGASRVYAVDVSECALPKELVDNDKVVVKDKLNARYMSFDDIGVYADIIVVDVSFIPLRLVLPALTQFMKPATKLVALIKPQYEVGRAALTKSGIVKNKKAETAAIDGVKSLAKELKLSVVGVIPSSHQFEDKNQEYLMYCVKCG